MTAGNTLFLDMRRYEWQSVCDLLMTVKSVARFNSIFVTLQVDSSLKSEVSKLVIAAGIEDNVHIDS